MAGIIASHYLMLKHRTLELFPAAFARMTRSEDCYREIISVLRHPGNTVLHSGNARFMPEIDPHDFLKSHK
jgi:hypothetical protein